RPSSRRVPGGLTGSRSTSDAVTARHSRLDAEAWHRHDLAGYAGRALYHRDPALWGGEKHWLAQISALLHLDPEPAPHLRAQKLLIRGAAARQAMLRGDDLHARAQRPQHPRRAEDRAQESVTPPACNAVG